MWREYRAARQRRARLPPRRAVRTGRGGPRHAQPRRQRKAAGVGRADDRDRGALGAVEIWEIHNFTEDAHAIHIHEITFEIVNRQPLDGGGPRPPASWEAGRRDTVIAYPG